MLFLFRLIIEHLFQGKKSRASSSDSSGDEKKGRGRDKAREKVSSNSYIFGLIELVFRDLK